MDIKQLKKIAENPLYISSIYNYCDRWCERCPFTSRCLNFALSEEQANTDPKAGDMNDGMFWRNLAQTLKATIELMKETAEEYGIDLDSTKFGETTADRELTKELVENHECSRAAKTYADMVDNWFDTARDFFESTEENSLPETSLKLPQVDPIGFGADIRDAVAVIHWYQHQIYVKLIRAIRGELQQQPQGLEAFAKDSDGSAKVALIAIDRSIAAWAEIRGDYPEMESDTLDLIVHLERLRRKVEQHFPSAREFIRPGFDKIDLNS